MTAPPEQVRALFLAALRRPVAEWDAFLADACSDKELRRAARELLDSHLAAGSFLDRPAVGADEAAADAAVADTALAITPGPGVLLAGRYRLVEPIGEGGMGTVWMAQQSEPVRRQVAIKLIKPGMDSKQVLARFEAERQALALMDHPNIAKVFDAGTADSSPHAPREEPGPAREKHASPRTAGRAPHAEREGSCGRPFFVMELVQGTPITKYCDERHLTPRQRLELFVPVCHAVQHAHQKGIIHRDLKPSNVLVALYDDRPVPKVIDFGVAKATRAPLTESTLHTGFGSVVGTLEYMSPEQAEMNDRGADTRSDIYSLGVLLYELLTGSTPLGQKRLKEAAYDEILRMIKEEEPPKPSTRLSDSGEALASISAQRHMDPAQLTKLVRGDLDWIVMKCLEKDRDRRYETANGLAQDLERYLADEPVLACPPSAGYRLRKFARRHRAMFRAAAAFTVVLILAVIVSTWQAIRATMAERTARAAEGAVTIERDRAVQAESATRTERDKVLAEKERADEEAAIAKAVNDFIQNDLFGQAAPALNPRASKVTVEELLGRASARIAGKFDKQPRTEAAIRQTIGDTYRALGNYPAALPHLERALELRRRVLGDEHPDTLATMRSLALLYQAQSQNSKAEPFLIEALATSRRVYGPEARTTLTFLNDLAMLHARKAEYARGEELFVQVLEVRRRVLGEDHLDTLGTMNDLALLYLNQDQWTKAETLFLQTLERRRHLLTDEDPDTLDTMQNLALAYASKNQFAKAEPLYLRTLELRRRVLGEDHPTTFGTMSSLASLYMDQRQYAKAEALFIQTLEVSRRVLGEDHHLTLVATNGLATLYWRQKELDRSIPLFEQTLKRYQANPGPDHLETVLAMANLGVNYRDGGRLQEGIGLLEQAWEMMRKRPDFPPSARAWIPSVLAEAYNRDRQFAKAEPVYSDALEQAWQIHAADSLPVADALYLCGRNLLQLKKSAEAEPLLRECLKIREQKRPDDWNTFDAKALLGGSLFGQRKYAEAEPVLLAAYEALKQREARLPARGKIDLTEARNWLARLYEATGNQEMAAEWRSKR